MKKAIAVVLTAAALIGCDNTSAPGSAAMVWNQVDPASGQAWRLTREGVVVQRNSGQPQSVTVALPGWVWAGTPYCPPDLALGPQGEAIVTSNVLPTLWKVDPQTLAVTVHAIALDADNDKDVGFSGLVYAPDQRAFFAVSDVQRSLWRIDPLLTKGQKLGTAPDWKGNFRLAQRLAYSRGSACSDLS